MDHNLRPELPPASLDLAPPEDCGNELIRTSSDASALTAEYSKDVLHSTATATATECTEWTNEKHSSYLQSLEASFIIKQLHRSMGVLAASSDRNARDSTSSQQTPTNTCNKSNQFMVLRDGVWRKINFQKNQPPLEHAAHSRVVIDSPWVAHFRGMGKGCTFPPANLHQSSTLGSERMELRGKRILSHRFITKFDHLPVCNQDSVGSITEGSDQNFVDDDDQDKKPATLPSAKRLKTADAANASSKDQIVPSGKFQKF